MKLLDEKLQTVSTENKAVIKETGGVIYLRWLSGSLYNPFDLTHKCNIRKTTFMKVDSHVHELYLKFLENKMMRYKTLAEREQKNKGY